MKVLLVVLALLLACGMLAAHGKLPPAPGLEGSTVANLTAHICDSGRGRGHAAKASTHRLSFSLQVLPAPCLLLRPAGCAPLPRGTEPAPRRPPGRGPCLQLGDPVPARSLQMRAGDSALLGTQPGAAQVPGPRQALLMERGPPRTHLRAGKQSGAQRGARSRSQPSSSGLCFGFDRRKAALVRSCVIRHWIRGGRAAQTRYFCSEKQGRSGTPAPCHSEGRDGGSQHKLAICPLWLWLPTRKALHGTVAAPPAVCFTAE
ncbi:uncharacterized protein LOC118177279 isoform X2 [Oxyura jamaicensis]|uniref:uncharacterized protein LOC118177279 isoform X2 n=1 Tax=Oxyura jamaicensis TaxID=8884 RepID=UPI0015A5A4BA|nr:uncharacterized protein LOC118177279 isoform X2 [Oxyura jamaicensis]